MTMILPPAVLIRSLSPGLRSSASRASRGITIWFLDDILASAMLYIIAESKAPVVSIFLASLPEPVFQFDAAVGFSVAVLYDDWGVEREIPIFCFRGGAFFYGAR